MLAKKILSDVFRPQAMYSLNETRSIFIKLAHSSIMRLNESSMSKLFDLMLMGLKLQTIQSCYPEEMVHVAMNHLETMTKMIDAKTEAADLIDDCKTKFVLLVN